MSVIRGRNEGLGSGARGNFDDRVNKYNTLIYYGRVMEIADDNTNRIKVRIKGLDDKKTSTAELPWSHSFLPMMVNVLPQEGETVKVILMDTKNTDVGREWIGPIISDPYKIKRDPHFFTSLAGRAGGLLALGRSIKTIAESDGIYPKENDVSLLGRDNSDVILRKDEVILRAGKHHLNNPLKRNEKNPGYIKINVLDPSKLKEENKSNSRSSSSTDVKALNLEEDRTDTLVVSNKIFLIGRDSNSSVIKPLIEQEDQIELEKSLHPLVYGDVLLEFMELFQNWMVSHIHEGDRLGSDLSGDTLKLVDWFRSRLTSLVSKNVWAGGDVPVRDGRVLPSDKENGGFVDLDGQKRVDREQLSPNNRRP